MARTPISLKMLYLPKPLPNSDTETGFCPRIDKHTLILHNPTVCILIVLGTAGLFVLLISLSQRLVGPPSPHLPSSFSYRWAKPSISLLQAAFVITPTHLLFAHYPKSSKSTWVACAGMLVFSNAKEEQHFLFLLQVTPKSLTSTDCMAYIPHEIKEL